MDILFLVTKNSFTGFNTREMYMKRLLYMNFDGFGWYYYDTMPDREQNLPSLTRLIREGVLYERAWTGIPSITFPMQCAIVSGCYSNGTGNCDKSLDRERNEIVSHRRRNRAQTAAEALSGLPVNVVSIQQFALEDRGCRRGCRERLYVQPGGDYKTRFHVLQRLIQSNTISDGDREYRYDSLPEAIFFYADDLDAIGHNPPACYSDTEEERVKKVQQRLKEMDRELGITMALLEEVGLYDSTYVLLTTDHGMISYRGKSRAEELRQALLRFGFQNVVLCREGPVRGGEKADVILTSHDIQCQVYFTKPFERQEELAVYLQTLPFVDAVLTGGQLAGQGVCKEYADMLVSPAEGECFSMEEIPKGRLLAAHDSLHEKCRHIFALAKGPDLPAGMRERRMVYNIEFLPELFQWLSWPLPADSSNHMVQGDEP